METSPAVTALILADTPRPRPDGPPPSLSLHNGATTLSLAVAAFHTAGINDVRVVTTHDQPEIIEEARRCAGTALVNAECSQGLLPLLCTGIADLIPKEEAEDPEAPLLVPEKALPPAVDAFFALPAQRAGIHPDSIAALGRVWLALSPQERAGALVFSAHAGRCGQLLLIGSGHAYPLLQWQGGGQWQDQWQWRGGFFQYAASLLHDPEAQRLREGIVKMPCDGRQPAEPFFLPGKKTDTRVCCVPLDDPKLSGAESGGQAAS